MKNALLARAPSPSGRYIPSYDAGRWVAEGAALRFFLMSSSYPDVFLFLCFSLLQSEVAANLLVGVFVVFVFGAFSNLFVHFLETFVIYIYICFPLKKSMNCYKLFLHTRETLFDLHLSH